MATVTTRLFRSGNSEAVRLPKEVAYGRDLEVIVERVGEVVTIRPVKDATVEKQKLINLVAKLEAMSRPPIIQTREPIEFTERRDW